MHLLNNLSPQFHLALKRLVKDIDPAAVVCFGHSNSTVRHSSCFQTSSTEQHCYDLLIVQSNATKYKDHEVTDIVRSIFQREGSVNVLSHSEQSVIAALQQKHRFFSRVFKEGQVLHIAETLRLEFNTIIVVDTEIDHVRLVDEYQRSFALSQGFLEMASESLGSQLPDVAVFLLHQAVEQMCIASIKAHLKYTPTSHSIGKLIGLVGCYLPQAKDIFPCNTNDERQMFGFLRRAYSDVRYKANYRTPPHIVFSLLERVYDLQNLIDAKYNEEFTSEEVGSE